MLARFSMTPEISASLVSHSASAKPTHTGDGSRPCPAHVPPFSIARRPASVVRYRWRRLVGLSGIVLSIQPRCRSGLRYAARKCHRWRMPAAFCSSSRVRRVCAASRIFATGAATGAVSCAVTCGVSQSSILNANRDAGSHRRVLAPDVTAGGSGPGACRIRSAGERRRGRPRTSSRPRPRRAAMRRPTSPRDAGRPRSLARWWRRSRGRAGPPERGRVPRSSAPAVRRGPCGRRGCA